MKRFLCLAVSFIMLLSLCSCSGLFIFGGDITGCSKKVSIVGREIPSFTARENGDFTILQFTDTHFICGSTKKDEKTLEAIEKTVTAEKPDIVVISGDMIEGNNSKEKYNKKTALEAVGELFESLGQYWAYVPGNNDGEMDGSSADVAAFLSQYEHCVVSNVEGLTGATQYSVDITDTDGNIVHSLIFMDSLAKNADDEDDYMKSDQVQWLKSTLAEKKEKGAYSSVFFHMSTPNFANAGKYGEEYNADYDKIPSEFDEVISGNDAVDEVISQSETVGLVSIGHIHPDENWCSFYNGIYYHITRSSGYRKSDNPGCVKITVHTTAQSAREMYDFTEILF